MPQVFISYRREDTAGEVGRLYDRLAAHFGRRRVFLDVDAVPRGVDFRQQMIQAVRESDVFLLVIGKHWLGKLPDERRIMSADDYVRLELEAALESGVPVIPVLVDGAVMPSAEQLPESLGQVPYLNAAVVRMDQDFYPHSERLISDIETAARGARADGKVPKRLPAWWPAAAAAAVVVLAMAAWLLPKWIAPGDRAESVPSAQTKNRSANSSVASGDSAKPAAATGTGEASSADEGATASDVSAPPSDDSPPVEIAPFDPHRNLSAYGAVDLRQGMRRLADGIAKALSDQGAFQVTVGAFRGPPQLAASGGPRLQKLLQEELERLSITVKARADWGVSGEYHIVNTPAGDQEVLAVEIEARLVDGFGKTLGGKKHSVRVLNEREVCHMAGASVVLPPKGTAQERSQRLLEALRDPVLVVADNQLLAGKGSSYAVEFRSGGRTLEPIVSDAIVLLPLADVEQFEIVLHNLSDYHAAALVTLDGLNVFEFSTLKTSDGRPQFQEWIVAPHSSATLKGWHITNSEAWPFSVKSFPESAAALFSEGPEFGTVTVTFSAAWPPSASPPHDEPQSNSETGTGAGTTVQSSFKPTRMKFGVVRAAISARYEKP